MAPSRSGWRAELAGTTVPAEWEDAARALFALPRAEAQVLTDSARSLARIAFREQGLLVVALFAGPSPLGLMRDYLVTLPDADILTGRTPADRPDPGPILCSCFGVGVSTILTAIETEGLMSVAAAGSALSAGTNCGSCRPEIAALLSSARQKEAAQ